MSSRVCSKCGAEIPVDSVFCEECGAKLSAETESDTKRPVFKKAVYESQVEVEPSVSTTTTAKAPRTASKTKLLTSVVLLVIAVVSTAYLMYPSMPHTVSEVYIGSSTSTSTYVSYSTHLTETVVSAAITKQTCRREDCITRTLRTSSHSSFQTTEHVLSTQYNQVRTYSYTTSRSEIVPPYAVLGLDSTQFALVTAAELAVLIGIALLLLRPTGNALGQLQPPKVEANEESVVPELPTREPIEQEPVSALRNLGASKNLSRDGAWPVRDVSGDSEGHLDDMLYEDKFAKKLSGRKIGALASMLMVWVGWGIITFTTYEYFPSTVSPTSPVGLLFAIITVSVMFPLTRRAWRVFKES